MSETESKLYYPIELRKVGQTSRNNGMDDSKFYTFRWKTKRQPGEPFSMETPRTKTLFADQLDPEALQLIEESVDENTGKITDHDKLKDLVFRGKSRIIKLPLHIRKDSNGNPLKHPAGSPDADKPRLSDRMTVLTFENDDIDSLRESLIQLIQKDIIKKEDASTMINDREDIASKELLKELVEEE